MRHAPPWWPESEPWPPRHVTRNWRSHRARFMRRAGFGFAFIFLLLILGAARVVSWVLAGFPIALPPASSVFIAFAFLIVLVGFLSFAMRRFGAPLGDIVGVANRVADGDFSARLAEHGPASLRVVARAFNSMTSRLEKQEQQRRQLMADIAHELRTLFTVI